MTLEAGRILGHYQIVSTLGAGGMGEVYRARDTRLGREVALKLVLAEVSADPERLARFEREARVLAALNHPNIATLHGFETADADGTRFLVMELVEGETLADRIARGPIPTDEAIGLFVAIAEGLEAAHEKGIVHRDLKPANIKVAPDERVKILDFGLAKARAPESPGEDAALSHSPTLTLAATRRGEVLGTAAYMSPEQASGKAVDKRTDVWAFGGCLYEALTGRRAFPADDLPNTLAAVLRDEPDWGALPAGTPPRVRRLLQRCLAKKPRERLHDIADARLVLEESEAPAAGAGSVAPRHTLLAAALGFALASVAAAIAWIALGSAPPSSPSLRLDLRIAEATDGAIATNIVLSPDGTRIAYVIRRELGAGLGANDTLYVRELDELEGTALAEGAVAQPFFSPDGRWIAFFTNTTLEKVPVAGGTAVELAPADPFMQGDWSEDDRIVFSSSYFSRGLQQVSAAGGETTRLTDVPAGTGAQLSPHFLPGGRHLLFTQFDAWQGTREPSNRSSVRALDLESGAITTVLEHGAHARYLDSGHLVYLDGGVLFAVPFDLEALAATGPPVKSSATVFTFPVSDYPAYSVSRAGHLLYLPRLEDERNTAVWLDREGRSSPLLERGYYGGPRLSPDGTRLAVTELRDGNVDVYVYDLEQGTRTRLTFDPARDDDVVWSVDGEFLIFNSLRNGRNGIYRLEADGAGDAEPLFLQEGPGEVAPTSAGPGGLVAFVRQSSETGFADILVLRQGASEPEIVAASPASEELGVFSPDGRWIAYSKLEAGSWDVFVRAYPPRPGLTQVSSGGGRDPKWSRDGSELFYATDSGIAAVSVEARDGILRAGTPKLLFSRADVGMWPLVAGEPYPTFDVAPGGQRFVVIEPPAGLWGGDHVRLVSNFFAELERIAPAR